MLLTILDACEISKLRVLNTERRFDSKLTCSLPAPVALFRLSPPYSGAAPVSPPQLGTTPLLVPVRRD